MQTTKPCCAAWSWPWRPCPVFEAIALGGSRARGTATAAFRLRYRPHYLAPDRPIDVAALGKVAAILDDRGAEASVTPIGGWGPWIDGGGWLVVGGVHVDLLYRDLDRVAAAIDDAHAGKVERFYQPGHPHAFLPTIYMGEAACARLLHDPAGALAKLQRRTTPYPAALAKALRERFEWEAGFALRQCAQEPRPRRRLLPGGLQPSAPSPVSARPCSPLNGVYLLNEKGAVAAADGFALSPTGFAQRVAGLFADLGSGNHAAGLDRAAGTHRRDARPQLPMTNFSSTT